RLLRPASNPAKPSPRMGFLVPLSPGSVGIKAPPGPTRLEGLGNIFTEPSGFFVVPVTTGRTWVALGLNCQSVGQALPLPMLTGNPVVQRAKPESCHPPITASKDLLAPPPTH